MNLAREHFLQHTAEQAAQKAVEFGSMQELNAYEQQHYQLKLDLARLKQIQSLEQKNKLKAELILQHLPYVDGILQVQPKVADEVVSTMLVWSIDLCDFERALTIAKYIISYNLPMPDRFNRTPATFVTEEIAEQCLKAMRHAQPVDVNTLFQLQALVEDDHINATYRDMPDEVKAKLYLALGKATLQMITGQTKDDLNIASDAEQHLQRALELDSKCGAKKDLATAQKQIKTITSALQMTENG